MNRKRIIIISAVVVTAVLLCACGVAAAMTVYNTPLGPALNAGTADSIATPAVIANLPPAAGTSLPQPVATSQPPAPTAAPVSNCGKTGSLNYLIMGVDAPGGRGLQGPLAIRIVKVDFSKKTAAIFSFPRDLWIPVTGLEGYGITQARLGEAYLIAKSNGGMSTAAATNIVAQALNRNFGAVSDHYVTAKLATLASIIDTVGGITVNVPAAYNGTPYGFHSFPAGSYLMNGALALEYATAPSPLAQWNAVDRQTQVLTALFQKIFSNEIITKIPSLIPQFLQAVTTDLSLQQIMDLACISQQISTGQIVFGGVGPNEVTSGASGVLYPNTEAIRAKVAQLLSPS